MSFISKKHLPRRTFLKGLGVTVGLPFLDAMVPAFAATPVKSPRIGFVYVPHGMVMSRFTPDAAMRETKASKQAMRLYRPSKRSLP